MHLITAHQLLVGSREQESLRSLPRGTTQIAYPLPPSKPQDPSGVVGSGGGAAQGQPAPVLSPAPPIPSQQAPGTEAECLGPAPTAQVPEIWGERRLPGSAAAPYLRSLHSASALLFNRHSHNQLAPRPCPPAAREKLFP